LIVTALGRIRLLSYWEAEVLSIPAIKGFTGVLMIFFSQLRNDVSVL
jgi:hypothetical protein